MHIAYNKITLIVLSVNPEYLVRKDLFYRNLQQTFHKCTERVEILYKIDTESSYNS